jgi:superfamily II DNA or RNA helicase
MTTTKVYLRDAIYIPLRYVDEDHREMIVERYERHIYLKEVVCEKCEYFSERPSDVCSGCPNYKGLYKLHSDKGIKIKDRIVSCVRLPYGDRAGVKKIFGNDLNIVDKTPDRPMKRPFKIRKNVVFKPYQGPAIKKMLSVRSGVLKSPPRSGKTVMGAAFIAEVGQKTLILASQKDWLDNFHETFVGSDTQPAMTTINPKRIGFCKNVEDFEKYDVCLATYQTFLSEKGKRTLKKIKRMFGVLMIDEIQFGAALEFSRIISAFNVRYKFGLSGTPERKDSLEYIVYQLLGKVFHEVKIPRLRPRIEVVTPPHVGKLPQSWTYMVGKLEKHPKRLRHIAETAVKDVKAGHCILIPMMRVPVVNALAKAINRIAGSDIACAFTGQTPKRLRKGIIDKARKKKIRVLVGNGRMVSTGINIPVASMIYQATPSSNLPKADQRFSRVLTPYEGKLQPVFKYWLDDVDVVRNCMRAEHFGLVQPMFKPSMDPITKGKLDAYFRNKKQRFNSDEYTGGYI